VQCVRRFDKNGNGVLSFDEVDKAVREILGLDSMYVAKPVLAGAFQALKASGRHRTAASGGDCIERDEFRLLLVYVRHFFEMYVVFNRVDLSTEKRISLAEFREGLAKLAAQGIKITESETEQEFRSLDTNGKGSIPFDDFCHWASLRKLAAADEYSVESNAAGTQTSPAKEGGVKLPQLRMRRSSTAADLRMKAGQQLAASNMLNSTLISDAASREQAARQRLSRLKARAQRELTRAASIAAVEDQKERRELAASRMRAEAHQLVGRDLTERVRSIPPLTDDEVHSLSELFNMQLRRYDPDVRSFFRLFKDMDIDGSRRINFSELEHMVRGKLSIPEKKLQQEKLFGLWKRLDENESGFIDAGELSRFLRIGAPKGMTPAQVARARVRAAREQTRVDIQAASNKRLEKGVAARTTEVPKATPEDIMRFGVLFAKHLAALRPRGEENFSYYGLFKRMDADASGRVKFEEFESMVRSGLRLDLKTLPTAKLWGLWASIDENQNGFICSGEFNRWMRQAEGPDKRSVFDHDEANRRALEKKRDDGRRAVVRKEEEWARSKASCSVHNAAAMEAEAERLERLLGAVQSRGLAKPSVAMPSPSAGRDTSAGEASPSQGGTENLSPSPTKRKETIKLLSREVKKGGAFRIQMEGSVSVPYLLPSFAREEGNP
jgi:Ca2+-binding EF-hand superfamily protein